MSGRMQSRKEIMENANEGREHVQPTILVERVGPRRTFAPELGYDYKETMLNWHPTGKTLIGFVVTLIGLVALLLIVIWLHGQAQA
jgi:hypothetical protein